MTRTIILPHTMSENVSDRLLWASEVGRQKCTLSPSNCVVCIPWNATSDTVFNRLTFTKHQFCIGGHEWFISDIDDVPLRIFGSSRIIRRVPLPFSHSDFTWLPLVMRPWWWTSKKQATTRRRRSDSSSVRTHYSQEHLHRSQVHLR
jgi:hypothetical protein